MKRVTYTFTDDYLAAGLKEQAQRAGKSPSEYVEAILEDYLADQIGHRIVGYYDDGSVVEEKHFFTVTDLVLSVSAYDQTFKAGRPGYDGRKLIGYKVYVSGEEQSSVGAVDQKAVSV